jgi:hypothetical protein
VIGSVARIVTSALAMGLAVSTVNARDGVVIQGEPHPAMAAFLDELAAGDLDRASARISKVGDFEITRFSPQLAFEATREEFTEFLAACNLKVAEFRGEFTHYQDTEWECADRKRYLVQFLPEDAMFVRATVTRPYILVNIFETSEMREEREAAREARFAANAGAVPPPPITNFSRESQSEIHLRRMREEEAAVGFRDKLGSAVVDGDIEAVLKYFVEDTHVRYSTRDTYFDVSLEHGRAKGEAGLRSLMGRAITELGRPVSANCYKPDTPHAPHVCRWEMSNPENGLYAEMNFRAPNGMLSSIRFFRETPAESEILRQRAQDAGIIDG